MSELTKKAWETWTDRDSMWAFVRRTKLPDEVLIRMPLVILKDRFEARGDRLPALNVLLNALDAESRIGVKMFSSMAVSEATKYLVRTASYVKEGGNIEDWSEEILLYALAARAATIVREYADGNTYALTMAWRLADDLQPYEHEIRLAVPWEAVEPEPKE